MYMGIWTPTVGAILLVKREPTNLQIPTQWLFIKKTVWYAPHNLALKLPLFYETLIKHLHKLQVTRSTEVGYGLEILCVYRLYGAKRLILTG